MATGGYRQPPHNNKSQSSSSSSSSGFASWLKNTSSLSIGGTSHGSKTRRRVPADSAPPVGTGIGGSLDFGSSTTNLHNGRSTTILPLPTSSPVTIITTSASAAAASAAATNGTAVPARSQSINVVHLHVDNLDINNDHNDSDHRNFVRSVDLHEHQHDRHTTTTMMSFSRPRSATSSNSTTYSSSSPNSSNTSTVCPASPSPVSQHQQYHDGQHHQLSQPLSSSLTTSTAALYVPATKTLRLPTSSSRSKSIYDHEEINNNSNHAPPPSLRDCRHNSIGERIKKLFVRQPSLRPAHGSEMMVVFGGDLENLCYDYDDNSCSAPALLQQCISLLELLPHPTSLDPCLSALDCEGLYRVSGNAHAIHRLACAIDDEHRQNTARRTYQCLVGCRDIHVLTGLVKRFLRQLAHPLVPSSFCDDFIEAYLCPSSESDTDDGGDAEKKKKFRRLIKLLPSSHCITMTVLFQHLLRVSQHSEYNKMTINNIGVMFGPTLMRAEASPTTSTTSASSHHHSPTTPATTHSHQRQSTSVMSSPFFLTVPVSPGASSNRSGGTNSSNSSSPISIPGSKRSGGLVSSASCDEARCSSTASSLMSTSASSVPLALPGGAASTTPQLNKSASVGSAAVDGPSSSSSSRTRSNTLAGSNKLGMNSADNLLILNEILYQNCIVEFLLLNFDDIFDGQ